MPTAKLTQTLVMTEHCPVGQRKVTFYDEQLTGFVVEIHAGGARTYALKYTSKHGKQKQLKLGSAADLTCDKARALAKKAKARVTMGEDPAEVRAVDRRMATVAELADRYVEYVKTYKRSHSIDERYLRLHIVPRFGKLHLSEVRQQDVVEWLDAKGRAGEYAAATLNRWQVIISHMFKRAKIWGMPGAERNPLDGVSLKPTNNLIERFLSAEETGRLLKAVDASPNTQLGAIVRLLLLTGCRKREILDLKWSEIDMEKATIRLPMGRTKTGRTRYVPLSDQAMAVLQSVPRWEGCDWVVPNPKTLKPLTAFYNGWNHARKEAGVPEIRVHDLRHTFASWLVESGASLYVASKALGHASSRSTERYAHVSDKTVRGASNAAAGLIDWSATA
jgi:integrase